MDFVPKSTALLPREKRPKLRWLLLLLFIFLFFTYWMLPKFFYDHCRNSQLYNGPCPSEQLNRKENSDYCGANEVMRYNIRIRGHANRSHNFIFGELFNSSLLPLLRKFKLSDQFQVDRPVQLKRPGELGFVFVTAANRKYYPFLKTLLFNLKSTFACQQKVIVFDIDGFSEDPSLMEPLNAVCGLELRKLDWSLLAADVSERVNIFAWKFLIFSEIYSEFDTWIWVDTSIIFHDPKVFEPIFEAIEKAEVSELILPGENHHGMRFATNPRMYNFLPFAPDWFNLAPEWENVQWESNTFIVHKSEYTRKLLKWALLCASTRACIEPSGSPLDLSCDLNKRNEDGVCNRQDQSILNILTVNAEHEKLYNEGVHFLPHASQKHPRKGLVGHKYEVRRREKLKEEEEHNFVAKVNCCQKQINSLVSSKSP